MSGGAKESVQGQSSAFSVDVIPKLTNGSLKICSLNSSFVVLLRAHPDIVNMINNAKQREGTDEGRRKLVLEFEALLASTQATNLLGVKRFLHERHPDEESYSEGSTKGGYAVEALCHMLEDFHQECGGDGRFRQIRLATDDKRDPPKCPQCRHNVAGFSDLRPRKLTFLRWTPSVDGPANLQRLIEKYEEMKAVSEAWASCLSCGEQVKVQAVSELTEVPGKFFLESVSGATNTLRGLENEVSWGGQVFQPTGVLHYREDQTHYYASVKQGDQWWMVDDFCGEPTTWKRKYAKRRGVLETGGRGLVIHRLDEHVLLVLLERKLQTIIEEGETQVFVGEPWTSRLPHLVLFRNSSLLKTQSQIYLPATVRYYTTASSQEDYLKIIFCPQDDQMDVSIESFVSIEDEPTKCGSCEDSHDLIAHLEDSVPCRQAYMVEYLPRKPIKDKYLNDPNLLLLDLSLCLRRCLNTGSCTMLRDTCVSQWPKHLKDHPLCFKFYRSHPAVVEHLTDGFARDVTQLATKLYDRRKSLMRAKAGEESFGYSGFQAKMARQMVDKCPECGLLGPVDLKFKVTLERGGNKLACTDCHNEELVIHMQPENLVQCRKRFWNADTGESDHLVALRADHHAGHVLFPANVATDEQLWVREGSREEEHFTFVVPTTPAAIARLNEASQRASVEWSAGLKATSIASSAPRTLLLQDFGDFLQAASTLYRCKLAQFSRAVTHWYAAASNSATAAIDRRSPRKIDAHYKILKFEKFHSVAMAETLPWSDGAVVLRMSESEARSAWNGRVKTKVRVRLLSDDPAHWSPNLKAIIVKSFERDVVQTAEGADMLTCAGGCEAAVCSNTHHQMESFLKERMVGLQRLARIPIVLNYLKALLACYERIILTHECSQWDFKLKWERDTWDVYLVGNIWTKKKSRLNEKVASRRLRTEAEIVRRVVQRPDDMETVSLAAEYVLSR